MSSPLPRTLAELNTCIEGPNVLKETKNIINRMLQKVGTCNLPENYLKRAGVFTGLHEQTLMILKDTNVDQCLIPAEEILDVNRSVIDEELVKFYVCKKILPTTQQLFNALRWNIPCYVDIRSFRKILVKMNYVWKKIHVYGYVIIENPLVVFERYEYLKKIIKYRNDSKPIYFVGVNTYDEEGNYYNFNDSATPKQPVKHVAYAVSKTNVLSFKNIGELNEVTFEQWILDDFLHTIPPKGVIVLNKAKHNGKAISSPSPTSLKADMIEWLKKYNIPHNDSMSKAELYTLIEKYTNTDEKTYVIDEVMKIQGFSVLHIPDCIKHLTPASLVVELVRKNLKLPQDCGKYLKLEIVSSKVNCILDSISENQLEIYNNHVLEEEKAIFEKDLMVDSILDDLFDGMENHLMEGDADSDLPSFSDDD